MAYRPQLTISRVYNGHSLDELAFKAAWGVWGSWLCLFINVIALIAQFYVALYPVGGDSPSAEYFFSLYMAAPLMILLYVMWKAYSWVYYPSHRPLWVAIKDIDIYTGMREGQRTLISGADVPEDQRRASIAELEDEKKKGGIGGWAKAAVRSVI